MNLRKKKELAKRTFGVGSNRIVFVKSRLEDIKEAITKQDLRDLMKDNAIIIKEINGRRKTRKKAGKGAGNIRKKVRRRKRDYIMLTRKLRSHISHLKKNEKISAEDFKDLRKKIRNKIFRSKTHIKEYLKQGETK